MTTGFYIAGCLVAGTATGAVFGTLGDLIGASSSKHGTTALLLLLCAAVIGLALEAGVLGLRLPSVRRQVNDEWLYTYRGWFYGFGFGLQLGCGVATIVTTSSVYVAYAAALLTGSAWQGAAIGGALGLTRGLIQLKSRGISSPQALLQLSAALESTSLRAGRWSLASQAAIVSLTAVWLVVAVR